MTREEEFRGTWCATCFHNDVCLTAEEGVPPDLDGPCCLMYVTKLEGEWIPIEDDDYSGGGYWMCSRCSHRFSFGGFNLLNHYGFCPKCGANMKTEEGDQS